MPFGGLIVNRVHPLGGRAPRRPTRPRWRERARRRDAGRARSRGRSPSAACSPRRDAARRSRGCAEEIGDARPGARPAPRRRRARRRRARRRPPPPVRVDPSSWSATARRSASRWPQRTSRSSARRWSAELADRAASTSAALGRGARRRRRARARPRARCARSPSARDPPGTAQSAATRPAQPAARRALGLQQRAQREQDVGQRLGGRGALEASSKRRSAQASSPRARRAAADQRAERAQLVLLRGRDRADAARRGAGRAERERLPRAAARPRPGRRREREPAAS